MDANSESELITNNFPVEVTHVGSNRNCVEICLTNKNNKKQLERYKFGDPLVIGNKHSFSVKNIEKRKIRIELKFWKRNKN